MSEEQLELSVDDQAKTGLDESDIAAEAEEKQPEKIEFSEAQQQHVNKALSKKAFEGREHKRRADGLQTQLDEAKAQIPQQTRPEVAAMPDQFDDDFQTKMAARDTEYRAQLEFDAKAQAQQLHQQAQAQAQQQEQQRQHTESITQYAGRGTKLGVSDVDMGAHVQKIMDHGVSPQIQDHLLKMDQGPLVSQYFANNDVELLELAGLDPISAGLKIQSILDKAVAAGKKPQPEAPDPTTPLSGGGQPKNDGGLDGATYDYGV